MSMEISSNVGILGLVKSLYGLSKFSVVMVLLVIT